MRAEQIKRIFNGAKYPTNEITQTPEIRALLFTTNQGIDYHTEFINVDETTNMIKIKKYKYQVCSGKLTNLVNIDGNLITTKTILYLRNTYFPFRAPKVGDVIFLMDKNGNVISSTKTNITRVGSTFIETADAILNFDTNKHVIIYADPELFENSVQDKRNLSLFLKYSPITSHTYDLYLDGGYLLGIEMHSPIVGSI